MTTGFLGLGWMNITYCPLRQSSSNQARQCWPLKALLHCRFSIHPFIHTLVAECLHSSGALTIHTLGVQSLAQGHFNMLAAGSQISWLWKTWEQKDTTAGASHCPPHTGLSWCCLRVLHCSRHSRASDWRRAPSSQTCTGCKSHSGASPESLPPPGCHRCWLSASPEEMTAMVRCLCEANKV